MSIEVSLKIIQLKSNENFVNQKSHQQADLINFFLNSSRTREVVSSRQTTVIGAAANSGSGRNLSPSRPAPKAAPKREFSGIVIGLRHDRRKRLIMPFDDFMY